MKMRLVRWQDSGRDVGNVRRQYDNVINNSPWALSLIPTRAVTGGLWSLICLRPSHLRCHVGPWWIGLLHYRSVCLPWRHIPTPLMTPCGLWVIVFSHLIEILACILFLPISSSLQEVPPENWSFNVFCKRTPLSRNSVITAN